MGILEKLLSDEKIDRTTLFSLLDSREFFDLSKTDQRTVIARFRLTLVELSLLTLIGRVIYGKDFNIGSSALVTKSKDPVESILFVYNKSIDFEEITKLIEKYPFPSLKEIDTEKIRWSFTYSMETWAKRSINDLIKAGIASFEKKDGDDVEVAYDNKELICYFNKKAANLYLTLGGGGNGR